MARRKVNRSELIREALGTGLATAKEVIEHVQKKHGITVNDALVYNVKNLSRSKVGKRKPGPKPNAAGSFIPQAKSLSHSISIADIAAVKGLLQRIGGAGVKELVEVLA